MAGNRKRKPDSTARRERQDGRRPALFAGDFLDRLLDFGDRALDLVVGDDRGAGLGTQRFDLRRDAAVGQSQRRDRILA
ncbi:MAG: hypothetical protein ACYC5S_07320, partial [Thiobacillus sp.]